MEKLLLSKNNSIKIYIRLNTSNQMKLIKTLAHPILQPFIRAIILRNKT